MCDSQQLRDEFRQPEISDGWVILSSGEGSGNYGYGSRDTLMYLRGPDGLIYCYEGSCCSCNDLDGSFDPVETNVETIEKDLAMYVSGWPDTEKATVCREALACLATV